MDRQHAQELVSPEIRHLGRRGRHDHGLGGALRADHAQFKFKPIDVAQKLGGVRVVEQNLKARRLLVRRDLTIGNGLGGEDVIGFDHERGHRATGDK